MPHAGLAGRWERGVWRDVGTAQRSEAEPGVCESGRGGCSGGPTTSWMREWRMASECECEPGAGGAGAP